MPEIDDQRLYSDLDKKNFKPVYFLHGDEPYLLNQCTDRFKYSVLTESTVDFNFSVFYAGDTDVVQIKDAVETLPVFSSHRLVILKNAQDLKDSELSILEPVLTRPVESTVFVMMADKVDKRKKQFKVLADPSTTVEFKKPFDNKVPQWILHISREKGLKISDEAIRRLHRLVGNNLTELDSQLGRVRDYIGDKSSIDLADINAVVSLSREENIFDFTKALGQKDRVKALEQLVNLLDQGQKEAVIINLVARHLRILLTIRTGLDQGIGGAKLATIAGVSSYFIEEYCEQARLWPVKKIEDALCVLHETSKALRSSPQASHIWLENMVLKSCTI